MIGEPRISAAGLAYRLDGRDDLPWLVLSNAIATDMSIWQCLIPSLTQAFRVLRHDARGHGRSTLPDGPMSLRDYAQDTLDLMTECGIASAHLAGVSMGAMTSLLCAERAPDRVLSISYCNAILRADEIYKRFWHGRARTAHENGLEALVDATLDRWLSPDAAGYMRARASRMFCTTSTAGFATAASALADLDVEGLLSSISCPIHFVAGARDVAAPPDVMRAAAGRTAGTRFTILANAAHISPLEAGDELARCLIATARM